MSGPHPGLCRSICTAAAVRRATRQLSQLYDDALAPLGIKATQLTLLNAIHTQGNPALSALAQDLVMDLSALGHTLKPLVRDGLVVLTPDSRDRRVKRAGLTPTGQARLRDAALLWSAAHARTEAMLGPERATALRELLDDIASPAFAEAFLQGLAATRD